MSQPVLQREFVWRRLHSLFGLALVLFLVEHLLTNSQAGLWIVDPDNTFVKMVGALHDMAFLRTLEVLLIGIPLLFHGALGIKYLFAAKFNACKTDGTAPSLDKYPRNHAYTWQRITSWMLLFLILFHVIDFRFLEYPKKAIQHGKGLYLVQITFDEGLHTLRSRAPFTLYDLQEAETVSGEEGDNFIDVLHSFSPRKGRMIAATGSFGVATLLTVRDTFKNPFYVALYTLFVLAASFHAFNGFWTFLITWGMILGVAAQKRMGKVALMFMALIALLGLVSIWGSYLTYLIER